MKYFDLVFDVSPSSPENQFIEAEDDAGKSFNVGEWSERANGTWQLRVFPTVFIPTMFVRQPGNCGHERASIKCPDCGIDFIGKFNEGTAQKEGESRSPPQDAPVRKVEKFPPESSY